MTLQALQQGVWYPDYAISPRGANSFGYDFGTLTADATGEKIAFLGQINIVGKATSKTFSSAGAKIHFKAGTITFATATSTIRIGLQGFSSTSGPPKQPDGSWSTYKDMVQGTDTFTSAGWNSITMAAGTATLSHGDYIAVVFDFTTRAGSDALNVSTLTTNIQLHSCGVTNYTTSWQSGVAGIPICVIEFDDGTLATIDGSIPISAGNRLSYVDADSPDENGLIFQVPYRCKVDAIWMDYSGMNAAAADGTFALYSTPLGTPSSMVSGTLYGERDPSSVNWGVFFASFAEQTLEVNTDYCIAVKATSTGAIRPYYFDVNSATYRALINGGTNSRLGSRSNSTGAFSETTTRIPIIRLRVCALDDGAGGGGGGAGPLIGGRLVL